MPQNTYANVFAEVDTADSQNFEVLLTEECLKQIFSLDFKLGSFHLKISHDSIQEIYFFNLGDERLQAIVLCLPSHSLHPVVVPFENSFSQDA